MRRRHRSPAMIVLGILLILILIGEGCFLCRFVQRNILHGSATTPDTSVLPDGDGANPDILPPDDTPSQTTPDADAAVPDAPDTPDTPDDADTQTPDDADTPSDPLAARALELLDSMSLHEKICQLFVVTPESLTGVAVATRAGETTRAALEDYPVGGLVYFAQNLVDRQQTREMISASKSYAEYGLLIAVDEEGGPVARLMDKLDTTRISAMYTYKDDGADTARENAATIAADIASFGFNTDFAPVADVWSNASNTVIGKRAYSDDYAQAAELIAAAVEGFHSEGVICTLKHFPGHGDTAEDSHTASAYVNKTHDELASEEWLPFSAGIEAGADMVMVGHLTVPALSDDPATLSYEIVTECLRGELGFSGVVITDSLTMQAVSDLYGSGELAVRAIEAGCDLLLEPESLRGAVDGVTEAVASGRLSESRINESVLRILTLKLKYGILT